MTTAKGFQVIGVADGGPSARGENVWYQLDLFDGTQRFRAGFFVAREKFAAFIQDLIHFGGETRREVPEIQPSRRGRRPGRAGLCAPGGRRSRRRIDRPEHGDPRFPDR